MCPPALESQICCSTHSTRDLLGGCHEVVHVSGVSLRNQLTRELASSKLFAPLLNARINITRQSKFVMLHMTVNYPRQRGIRTRSLASTSYRTQKIAVMIVLEVTRSEQEIRGVVLDYFWRSGAGTIQGQKLVRV